MVASEFFQFCANLQCFYLSPLNVLYTVCAEESDSSTVNLTWPSEIKIELIKALEIKTISWLSFNIDNVQKD